MILTGPPGRNGLELIELSSINKVNFYRLPGLAGCYQPTASSGVTRQEYWNVDEKVTLCPTLTGNGVGSGRLITTQEKEQIRRDGCMLWTFQGKGARQDERCGTTNKQLGLSFIS